MADPLAAREQRIGELIRFERDVSLHVLEPLHGVACGILQPQCLDHPFVLIRRQRLGNLALGRQRAGQSNGVFHGQLGAGPNREVRRVRRVAHEHDVPVTPGGVAHAHEVGPGRRQVARVGHQPMPFEPRRKQGFACRHRAVQIQPVEPGAAPRRLIAFDDEGGRVLVEAITVRLEHPVLVLDEVERERSERERGAQPDELRPADVEVGLEMLGVARPDGAVDAVGGHDHIRVVQSERGQVRGTRDLGLVAHRHAKFHTPCLQDVQERAAGHARKAMAARRDDAAADVDIDVVPVREAGGDGVERRGISGAKISHRLVGEHDAPAEGIAGTVPLVDGDLGVGSRLFQKDREVEPGGASADHGDVHGAASPPAVANVPLRCTTFFTSQ